MKLFDKIFSIDREGRVWDNYAKASKELIEFYEKQNEEAKEIPYYDNTTLLDRLWEEDSCLYMIKKIHEQLK